MRDITGTGTLLAYRAGAALRNAEFCYVRPGTPKFYFEGITFAIQEGARWVNAKGEAFMDEYEPDWGDEADVPRIAARWRWKTARATRRSISTCRRSPNTCGTISSRAK